MNRLSTNINEISDDVEALEAINRVSLFATAKIANNKEVHINLPMFEKVITKPIFF